MSLTGTPADLSIERLCCGSYDIEPHQADCPRKPMNTGLPAYETALQEKLAAVVEAEARVVNAQNLLKQAMADFTRAAELEANRT